MSVSTPHILFTKSLLFFLLETLIKLGGYIIMNSENQRLIIYILGGCLLIALTGTILLAVIGQGIEIITIFLGIVTTIIGILATFLTGKNMTEKQEETLEKYTLRKHINEELDMTDGDGDVQ